ncbi:MAG: sugar ABC transporter permease [Oscillospiraceae bacterium]|nr:sugar ABC transporter permease [Oscillospiraceae bacterium]
MFRLKRRKQEWLQGYLFVAPSIIILGIFICLAVLFVIYLSFHRVNLFQNTYEFVGLENFIRLRLDHTAMRAIRNTLTFSAVVVTAQTMLALILAYVLSSNIRGRKLFRSVLFLPTLTSSAALTLIFMFMFNIQGPVNNMLLDVDILSERINFLQNTRFTLPVIMVMNIWSTVPFYMTLYIASLVDMPSNLYEAASIDGANVVQKFFRITVPYLRPITTFVLLTGIIGTLQMFDQAYIFSDGSGGPANSTLTIALLVYRYAFGPQNAMGYAATLAVILALIILTISLIVNRINKEERVY